MKRWLSALSPALVISLLALFVALGGTSLAASNVIATTHKDARADTKLVMKLAPKLSVKHAKTADSATTAASATHATTATSAGHATLADTATNAGHATNSDQLGGSPKASFQLRATGTCAANSAITQVNPDGSVGCSNVRFYSGRLVEALNGGDTFLTIPGVAHLVSLNCQAANANAALINDALGTTDLWAGGDTTGTATSYVGTNWFESNSTFTTTGAAVWHLGQGSGAGAKLITITANTEATGSNCIFQGTAEVITTS